jgi:hypothetical protein
MQSGHGQDAAGFGDHVIHRCSPEPGTIDNGRSSGSSPVREFQRGAHPLLREN